MDSRPSSLLPLLPLLLTSLLNFWPCATGQSSYVIDTVGLAVLPRSTVESGTNVTLRCQVSVSHDNIPHLNHTFQLTRDDVPVHSSTTTEDSVMFELSPARAADSGNYECRVTVRDKSQVSFSQKLDVTGLQTPILYLNKTEPYEKEEFTATCSAPEEKGPLIFHFFQKFRTGEVKKMKQIASNGNSSETTLVLRTVGDSLLYCAYEINLVSGIRHSNRSSEILVIVRALHISPVMNVLPSSKVYEGDVIEVFCKVVSHLKNIEVFLTKDRRILKQAQISLNHRFTTKAGDSGELVCKAEWGNVQKETYQVITVQELFSKPRLSVQPIDIFEGEIFKLTCSISIYVPERINNGTMRFSMHKDNVRLNNADTYNALAHPSKNGNYTCKAQAVLNTMHYIVKESQTVVVEAKVPASKPVLSVVGGTLVLGRRFQLLCQSDTGTLPIVYNLFGPNKLFETRKVSKPGEQAIFNCSAIHKRSDVNDFLCHAKNGERRAAKTDTGQLLASTKIIEPVSRPVLSMLPGMRDVSEGQEVTLECSVQSGTLPINFTWYKETEGALNFEISRKLKASYRIRNVRGEHRGDYYCVSTNPANETKGSHRITISVKMATWKKALIAVVCILPILVLVLFVIFKRRLLPFQRKTGELSVKSASKTERQSLTLAEVNEVANVTPGMIGKSVWSEHVSGSESDDQNSVTSPENPEPEYTEVQTKQADPHRAPLKKDPDTVYSEVRNSMQGVPGAADGQGSVEYAQLNHDADHHGNHGNHGDHFVQDDHIDEIESSVDNSTADQGE